MSRKCKFNKRWLDKHDWLEEIPKEEGRARCKICNSIIELGTRGYANITKHSDTRTHQSNENAASNTVSIDRMMMQSECVVHNVCTMFCIHLTIFSKYIGFLVCNFRGHK